MLSVYTRHHPDCKYAGEKLWRRCNCPKWIWGALQGRSSARVRRPKVGNRRRKTARNFKKIYLAPTNRASRFHLSSSNRPELSHYPSRWRNWSHTLRDKGRVLTRTLTFSVC